MMRNSYIPILAILVLMLNPSCVSKKKYLEMQSFRQKADAKVAELNGVVADKNQHIEKMQADFEQMKNELMESNAIKDQSIDSLSGEVNNLTKAVNAKESAIGQKETSFSYEKRQLIDDLSKEKKLVESKQAELDRLSDELKKLNDQLSQQTFDLNRIRDEKTRMQTNLDSRDAQIKELNAAADKLKAEIESQKKLMKEKNETINRLQNNVKLLKQQIK